jgi:Flp pilus assembly protein TadD
MRYVPTYLWLTVFLATAGIGGTGFAQRPAPAAPAQPNFDPSDVYYQAWLFVREAESLQKQGRHAEALEKFRSAERFFETINRYHPDWKKEMVGDRLSITKGQITKVLPLAQAQQQQEDVAVAEIIESGGTTRPVAPITPNNPGPMMEIEDAKMKSLEAEVSRLRKALAAAAAADTTESSRNAARASDLEKQRDDLNARLKQSTTELESLRARMATAPVQSEMDRLNERLRSVEQERQAMGMALSQSREQQLQSQAKIQTLQADFQAMRQQASDLQRNLEVERKKSNEVTAAQVKQLQQLEKTLKQKDGEIATANNRIASLQKELQESQDANQELRTEREDLLRQREHMTALLKLSENGRMQQLIEQNMGLAKELREAKERVERISKNNDETNDQLTEALRDLAITKTKIISLQTEKRAQDQRMADLVSQLQNNEKAIAAGETAASNEEAETLRAIIKRQQKAQEVRKSAAQLLLNAAKKQSTGSDKDYDEAVAMLTDHEITLTPEEQQILDARKVDGEIYSPYAGSKARVASATTEMHQQIDDYTKAAVRAFGSQRLSASREVLEMILDLHPGHIPTMTKLGIVQLRLDDPSAASQTLRAAVENDETRSLSHRLLGLALYKLGNLADAETSIIRAIEIDPNDAASYTIYGNTLMRLNRIADAEKAYQKSLTLNPESAEALHNLALLCQRNGRTKDAKGYYEKALLHGAQPNPDLEVALRKSR